MKNYYIILERADVYKIEATSSSEAYKKCRIKHIEMQRADVLDIVDEEVWNKSYAHRYDKPR